MRARLNLSALILVLASVSALASGSAHPTVKLKDLPQALRDDYMRLKPQFNRESRCAAAYDSHTQVDKMNLMCSIYIRMAAEGERRAMHYCEEKRAELKIQGPCRVVVEE